MNGTLPAVPTPEPLSRCCDSNSKNIPSTSFEVSSRSTASTSVPDCLAESNLPTSFKEPSRSPNISVSTKVVSGSLPPVPALIHSPAGPIFKDGATICEQVNSSSDRLKQNRTLFGFSELSSSSHESNSGEKQNDFATKPQVGGDKIPVSNSFSKVPTMSKPQNPHSDVEGRLTSSSSSSPSPLPEPKRRRPNVKTTPRKGCKRPPSDIVTEVPTMFKPQKMCPDVEGERRKHRLTSSSSSSSPSPSPALKQRRPNVKTARRKHKLFGHLQYQNILAKISRDDNDEVICIDDDKDVSRNSIPEVMLGSTAANNSGEDIRNVHDRASEEFRDLMNWSLTDQEQFYLSVRESLAFLGHLCDMSRYIANRIGLRNVSDPLLPRAPCDACLKKWNNGISEGPCIECLKKLNKDYLKCPKGSQRTVAKKMRASKKSKN